MSRRRVKARTIQPISNIPSVSDDAPDVSLGIPSTTQLEQYRLKNEVLLLQHRQKALLFKLSRCLEVLTDEERFFDIGLHYDQWETYDELMRRKARLRAMRELITDVNADPPLSEEQRQELEKKFGGSK